MIGSCPANLNSMDDLMLARLVSFVILDIHLGALFFALRGGTLLVIL